MKTLEEKRAYQNAISARYYHKHKNEPDFRERKAAQLDARRRSSPEVFLLRGAKRRAKKEGVAMTLTLADISIPTHCPVLGFPLRLATKGRGSVLSFDAPSLDRVDPKGGYTPDNVRVISYKANTFKGTHSLEEVKALYEYMREVLCAF